MAALNNIMFPFTHTAAATPLEVKYLRAWLYCEINVFKSMEVQAVTFETRPDDRDATRLQLAVPRFSEY
ncbi:hypothetical protein RRG08_024525 [Elysia crispata]|uniref:Uncharacterized protein n=1 Tax=Elysia crispata TaxID=231223 RepID=A0AAE0Y7H1_9GAST|nr:hypothetical protein RRG08_024525 [Elysia crispata]